MSGYRRTNKAKSLSVRVLPPLAKASLALTIRSSGPLRWVAVLFAHSRQRPLSSALGLMNRHCRISLAFLALLAVTLMSHAQTSASLGPELRQMFLNTTAPKGGVSANSEFPHVYGIALDWPIGEHVATVISLSDGCLLYTSPSPRDTR